MSYQERIVENTALPQQEIKPLLVGANNPFESAMMAQQNEAKLLNSLVGGVRRRKKSKSHRIKLKGGSIGSIPVIIAPSAPSIDSSPAVTNANFIKITELAAGAKNAAAFDTTTSQSQVAKIAENQEAVYFGKGGKKKRSSKKGGSFPVWGCLSGGKKSKKHKKTSRYKRKHRKTRKIMKRHRH